MNEYEGDGNEMERNGLYLRLPRHGFSEGQNRPRWKSFFVYFNDEGGCELKMHDTSDDVPDQQKQQRQNPSRVTSRSAKSQK